MENPGNRAAEKMKRVHIVGGKNHGKTTLVEQLIQSFRELGLCVGAIKHTHHQHELDTPGKDSHRHREAGAAVVGIITQSMHAVFLPPTPDDGDHDSREGRERRYERLAPMFETCDLVLVEGDMKSASMRIEVWREQLSPFPIARNDTSIAAVVSDDEAHVSIPVWPRSDVKLIAKKILEQM
jgi:molybdopterin-guanine dinucleotide biosynthesis protein MobB